MAGGRWDDRGPHAYRRFALAVASAKGLNGHDVMAIAEMFPPICPVHHAGPTSVPSVRPSVKSVLSLASFFASDLTGGAAVNGLRHNSVFISRSLVPDQMARSSRAMTGGGGQPCAVHPIGLDGSQETMESPRPPVLNLHRTREKDSPTCVSR